MKIYLEDIVVKKRERLKEKKYNLEEMMYKASIIKIKASFYDAMKKDELSIIGEIKKASPSKGLIKEDFKPLEIAYEYEKCVDAVSVLTEEDFFLGHEDYLKEVSKAISLPTLYKDFIVCKEQIYSAKILGASCILLIVAILSQKELVEFLRLSKELGLDALVETHTKEEIERALEAKSNIIGINNRDLKTFKTSLDTTINLRKYIPKDTVVISESGINTIEDIKKLKEVNINGILVGESFMRCDDIVKQGEMFKNAYK